MLNFLRNLKENDVYELEFVDRASEIESLRENVAKTRAFLTILREQQCALEVFRSFFGNS